MSRYSYAGPYKNPAQDFYVDQDPRDGLFYVYLTEEVHCQCGSDECLGTASHKRKHRGKWNVGFEEAGDAHEVIDQIHQSFDEDYESYLEENRYEIVQMERYEQFRNEY